MTEREIAQKKERPDVKTFPVPFALDAIHENSIIRTNTIPLLPKEQIINQAFKFHSQGNISEAVKCYQYCINQGFNDHRVFFKYGIILKSIGNLQEAEISYRKAIELNPNFPEAYYNLGNTLRDLGNLQEAEISLLKAIELNPNFASAHLNLGNLLSDLGKFQEAELSYQKAVEIKPDFADAHLNLGIIFKKLKNFEKAEISTQKAIEIKPDYAEAHSTLGNLLKDLGQLEGAEISYRKATEIKPDFANAHYNLGNTLRDLGKLQEAEISLLKAIELNPNFASAHLNLGNLLSDLGKFQEAELSTRKAIELNHDFKGAHSNLGNILSNIGKFQEAETSLRKAIELDPTDEEINRNLSLILLKTNNFKEGFNRYESRLKIGNNKPFITSKPEWTPIKKGRVLLWAEQGIGDEILFASLIPELVKKVDELIVQVDPRLIPLFQRSFDKRIIYIQKNQILEEEKYDFQIAMGSVIRYLRDDKKSFKKGKKKYLQVNEIKTIIFRDKILKDSKKKKIIGISWISKSPTHKNKTISLEKFISGIYSPNVVFLNLQYGDTKDEINKIKIKYNIDIFDLKEVDNFNNIDDLAALTNACDMVVSIENIIFALAGALGIESKILLKCNCQWFNGHNDLKSYWFENQSFFRQTLSGDWEKALDKIKKEIEASN